MNKFIFQNENIRVFVLAFVSILIIRFALKVIPFENKLTISTLLFIIIFLIINKNYLEKS